MMYMRMAAVHRVRWEGGYSSIPTPRSGQLLTKHRMVRSRLRSVSTEWTPALLVFPSGHSSQRPPPYPALPEHFPIVVFLKHYLSYSLGLSNWWGTISHFSFYQRSGCERELSSGMCLRGVGFDCLMAAYQPEGVTNVTGVQWYNFPAAPYSLLC